MTRIAFSFPLTNGLHARPAGRLRETCQRFAARVHFRNRRNRAGADAGSVLELVASDTKKGDPCLLEISGPQEKQAARALGVFLDRELPHADDDLPPPAPAAGPAWLPPVFHDGAASVWPGVAIASGIGHARAVRWQRPAPRPRGFAAGKKDPGKELQLFKTACRQMESDLRKKAAAGGEANAVGIIRAHLAILADPGFRERIRTGIGRNSKSAARAITDATAHYARLLQRSSSIYIKERVNDLDDVAYQLVDILYGPLPAKTHPSLRAPGVLVAATLSPSEMLGLDRKHLRGLVLQDIGLTSHTAILARSFGIPAVSLPKAGLLQIRPGSELIVDGQRALVIIAPGAALKRYYRLEETTARIRRQRQARLNRRPAATRDRIRVAIAANIAGPAELGLAWRSGAEGIGLFRSEFLFLERETPPGEEEQYDSYLQAARSAGKRPIIFRTIDIGGDKPLPYLGLPREANPFLGYRAVRFYAEHAALVRCQLRALLRASAGSGRLRVMVPMVAVVEEVRLMRRLLAEATAELRQRRQPFARRVELGVMVETPAAALSLNHLAREADFFSVGSNDLLQYTMAVDRGHTALSGLCDPLQPAFLRVLLQAAAQARKAKRWLGICGEMAGNREYLPLLVGIGFDELSMAPAAIPAVKERLAQLDGGECRDLLRRAQDCAEAAEVAALLKEFQGREAGGEATDSGLVVLQSASRTPVEAIKELCDRLELEKRVSDSAVLEQAVWERERTFATDLGFGFALPHARTSAVRAASVAFLRPVRPMHWSGRGQAAVRGVLLIAVPEKGGNEHLRLIARLSRRLMHDDFRARLLSSRSAAAAAAILRSCLLSG
jgi:fructose-specific PTS system IIA-like component